MCNPARRDRVARRDGIQWVAGNEMHASGIQDKAKEVAGKLFQQRLSVKAGQMPVVRDRED